MADLILYVTNNKLRIHMHYYNKHTLVVPYTLLFIPGYQE